MTRAQEDMGTWGQEDTGHGDRRARGQEDTGTGGQEDTGTGGHGDTGTGGQEDTGTGGHGDTGHGRRGQEAPSPPEALDVPLGHADEQHDGEHPALDQVPHAARPGLQQAVLVLRHRRDASAAAVPHGSPEPTAPTRNNRGSAGLKAQALLWPQGQWFAENTCHSSGPSRPLLAPGERVENTGKRGRAPDTCRARSHWR
jgi:hypothetical protein